MDTFSDDDEDTSLVEYGESPADYRRALRRAARAERPDHTTTALLAAGGLFGLAGVGAAISVGLTPVTYTLFGIAVPLAVIPVVRISRY